MRRTTDKGYVEVLIECRWIYEHRHVVETHILQSLPAGFEVHHIDLNPGNNDLENLSPLVFEDHAELHRCLARGNNATAAELAERGRELIRSLRATLLAQNRNASNAARRKRTVGR